jgi:hypothetical protein
MVIVVNNILTSGHWNLIASLYPALGSVIESWQQGNLALRAQQSTDSTVFARSIS